MRGPPACDWNPSSPPFHNDILFLSEINYHSEGVFDQRQEHLLLGADLQVHVVGALIKYYIYHAVAPVHKAAYERHQLFGAVALAEHQR